MDKLVSSSSTPTVDVNDITRRSQTRVLKTLEGEPEFIISVADTQNNKLIEWCYFSVVLPD
ncbi:MAG: hypothetical protein WCF03_08740, partial [Nitrososphaeraceae archaeon]